MTVRLSDSFYELTVTRPAYPVAAGAMDADVCVIGGGFTGLSTAIECAQRGLRVILLEAATLGFGASGRNGGQICTGYSVEPVELIDMFGLEAARDLFALSEEAKDIVRERGNDADLRWGYLFAAKRDSALKELAERAETLETHLGQLPGTMLNAKQLSARLVSPQYVGGHLDNTAGQLNPLKYVLALARIAKAAGVQIFENSAATAWTSCEVRTAQAEIKADAVVLAGNAYVSPLPPTLLPVASYVAATQPLTDAEIAQSIPALDTVCEFCNILNYYRIAPTGEMLFGAGATYSGRDPSDLPKFVRMKMAQVFPNLADKPFQRVWSGKIGISLSRIPEVGDDGRGTYWARGFSGQGVALTGLAGRLIAEAITGERTRYRLLSEVSHHKFPGGPLLRAPLQAAAMAYFRLRDITG